MRNERRKNKRLQVNGYLAQIFEGDSLHTGIVENVSLKGLRIRICRDKESWTFKNKWPDESIICNYTGYLLILSSESQRTKDNLINDPTSDRFSLTVTPRWKKEQGDIIIGFDILSYSEEWRQFILQVLPMRNLLNSISLPKNTSAEQSKLPFYPLEYMQASVKASLQPEDSLLKTLQAGPNNEQLPLS